MSDLLTGAEFPAIADNLELPTNALIDGKFTAGKAGKRFDTLNPATGDVGPDAPRDRPDGRPRGGGPRNRNRRLGGDVRTSLS